MDEDEITIKVKAPWVIGGIVLFALIVFGVAKGCGASMAGPEVKRQECIEHEERQRESCRGFIQTTKRVKLCEEIFQKAIKDC